MAKRNMVTGVLFLFFILSMIPLPASYAASPIYVRKDGDDSNCNGIQNLSYPGGGPGLDCAVKTIQRGINLVEAGGIVYVGQGHYKETLQDITKPLTLRSISGWASTTIEGNGRGYVIFIRDTAYVTIDGFTITNPGWSGGSDPSGIVVGDYSGPVSDVHHIRIARNLIHDVCSSTNNVVYGAVGINIGPSNGVEIDNNIIHSIHHGSPANWWANGISIWSATSTRRAGNVNIHDNTIYDISSATNRDAGIAMQEWTENVVIKNNVITNSGEYGIESRGDALSPVTMEGNEISGATVAAIRVWSPYSDTITGNILKDSNTGILVEEASSPPMVHYNEIYDNSQWGMVNDSPNVCDAAYNWWGHCTGPFHPLANPDGLGNGVSDNVSFKPWLRPCIGNISPHIYIPYVSLRPLAENNIGEADESRIEVENLMRLAQERGVDTSQCKAFYNEGIEYLSGATRFLQGNNAVAANTYAIYARREFEKARDCLKLLLG